MGDDQLVFVLKDRIVKSFFVVLAADCIQRADIESEQPGAVTVAIGNAKLFGDIALVACQRAVIHQNTIHSSTGFIHNAGADGPRPIDHSVVDWSLKERVEEQRERIEAGVAASALGVAAENV